MSKESKKSDNDLLDRDLVKFWQSLKRHPTVIALDLDYTLWPYYVDCHVDPPLTRRQLNSSLEIVVDSNGFDLSGFEDVTRILHTLKRHCLKSDEQHLAVASRSTTEKLARKVIDELGWSEYFSSFQIYPTNKIQHMKRIQEELKCFESFDEVLFFDDEVGNIKSTSSIGVVAIHVDDAHGLNMSNLKEGLEKYQKSGSKKSIKK